MDARIACAAICGVTPEQFRDPLEIIKRTDDKMLTRLANAEDLAVEALSWLATMDLPCTSMVLGLRSKARSRFFGYRRETCILAHSLCDRNSRIERFKMR